MIETVLSEKAARVMLLILTVIGSIAALYASRAILAPFVFAVVLGIVVSPLSDRLIGWGLPRVASATILLITTTLSILLSFLLLAPLLTQIIERLPRLKVAVRSWIDSFSSLLRGIETISEEIEETVGAETLEPQAAIPSISDALWLAPNFGAQVFIVVGTFFFFVLTREKIYAAAGRQEARLYRADRLVSRYFAAVTIVNVGVGVATAAAMLALGVEYAILWGVAAGLMNYILYLGPMIIIVSLLVAGLVQFYGAFAFLPPAAFLAINVMEANFVTPWFVGQHIHANPLVVFLSVIFGLWLWGPIGAIVALPVILWLGFLLNSDVADSDALKKTA